MMIFTAKTWRRFFQRLAPFTTEDRTIEALVSRELLEPLNPPRVNVVFSLINHPAIGVLPFMATPMESCNI